MLRSFAATLKTLSGADAVTLVVPSLEPDSPTPLVIHDGSSSPVPEMASLTAALRLLQGRAPSTTLNGHSVTQFESTDARGRLIRIVPAQAIFGPSDLVERESSTALWVGLRWPPGTDPIELRDAGGDRDRWWEGLLELGGALALGERERSRLEAQVEAVRRDLKAAHLIYRSARMETLLEAVRKLASSPIPLLIQGPSGAGKKLLAHTLHELSPWRGAHPILVHCGAMDRSSPLVRQLLGDGPVKEGEGGTLAMDGLVILDAVDELPASEQEGLLRFLERLDGLAEQARRRAQRAVRVIAVTHRDLAKDVESGRFRADLHRRLAVSELRVPPLAQRRDDILPLANHFLTRFSLTHGKRGRYLASSAEHALLEHPWPGNVRELQSRVLEALLISHQPMIGARELRLSSQSTGAVGFGTVDSENTGRPLPDERAADARQSLAEALEELVQRAVAATPRLPLPLGRWLARDLVLAAHAASAGVSRRAAARLGIPETTYRRRQRQASTEVAAGLARRCADWETIHSHLAVLVHEADNPGSDLSLECRALLLERVHRAVPEDAVFGATLMGITEPTYRRWLANAANP